MLNRQKSIWPTAFLLVSLGCSHDSPPDTRADEDAIESLYKERSLLIQNTDTPAEIAAAYVAVVADDAVWMPPNAPKVEGKAAIQSWAEQLFGSYTIVVKSPNLERLTLDGDLAVRRYSSVGEYIPKDGGEAVPYDQKYIDILERASGDSWRITHHMWSSNNTAPTVWQ